MSDPRHLLLSWEPTPGNENVKKWLDRFKKKLQAERRKIEVLDAREAGRNRAQSRENWTDFVSVLTADYVVACGQQSEHELRWALSLLRAEKPTEKPAEKPSMRFWTVRLDAANPSDWGFEIGPDRNMDAPWDKSLRWHYLPEIDKDNLDVNDPNVDKHIEKHCMSRLRDHVVQCAVCRGDAAAPAPVEPPVAGFLHRVQRLFRRS